MQDQLSENAEEVWEDDKSPGTWSSALVALGDRGGTCSRLLPATLCGMCRAINCASNNAAAEVESLDGCCQKLTKNTAFYYKKTSLAKK